MEHKWIKQAETSGTHLERLFSGKFRRSYLQKRAFLLCDERSKVFDAPKSVLYRNEGWIAILLGLDYRLVTLDLWGKS